MTFLMTNSGGVTARAYGADSVLNYELTNNPIPTSPTVTQETQGDVLVNKNTGASSRPGRSILVDSPVANFTLECLTTDIAALDGFHAYALEGATGTARIKIANRIGAASEVAFSTDATGAATTYDLIEFNEGTIGEGGFAMILSRLAAGGDVSYYNGATYAECVSAGGIARNASCWGKDFDLSGVPVVHLSGGFNGGGCLITPRHLICAHHYSSGNRVGQVLRFVGADGTIHDRAIIGQTSGSTVASENNASYPVTNDCLVFTLSSAVPASVKVYPIAGTWMIPHSLTSDLGGGIGEFDVDAYFPIITTNQNRKLLFGTCAVSYSGFTMPYPAGTGTIGSRTFSKQSLSSWYVHMGPLLTGYDSKQESAISGDSGSPWFFPMPDGTLAACAHYTRSNSGPIYYAALLNAMIEDADDRAGISTGYTVTVAPDPTA